ncbi:Kinase protein with adenine nucleotide alpha hydrolases-like domain putative isoform 1 [Tripterygium wilfordii]|uniref:RING-type E3 ubiquitin transferase n=1 Tax=Tripterygium wilfordii TaxID=458696 RepID=A0A7J7DQP2_TRIWF|nr:Kinase protein with adenine nucleotide alpha hydrolases-like domain putative isoform 1 [Tripterygium wilfordii]
MARKNGEKKEDNVAVAIDKDKGSQYALKWAVDHLLSRGQSLTLLHVKQTPSGGVPCNIFSIYFCSFFFFFMVTQVFLESLIKCNEIILEDMDIAKVLIDYVSTYSIEILVLGAPSRGGLVRRFKTTDVPSTVSKASPDFCTVYVISKGKISSVKSATGPPPTRPPRNQITAADPIEANIIRSQPPRGSFASEKTQRTPRSLHEDMEIKSPFNRGRASITKSYELSTPDSDISFVSSGRPSTDRSSFYDPTESGMASRLSISSDFDDRSFASSYSGNKSIDMTSSPYNFSLSSQESGRMSSSSQSMDDVEAEMRRLRQELKQTMDMYSSACKEALTAKEKARELYNWKLREEQKLEESRLAEEAALALAEKEKAKSGTFCYIDPEYQQTGMLGIKSDIYSLGIMLLQIITTKPPMGLTHHVQRAIEKGTFPEILDQAVTDWPVEEALKFAKLALQCAELRRKDRPDLGKVVLPELNRLRALAEESNPPFMFCGSPGPSPNHSQISTVQHLLSDPQQIQSGNSSRSSTSSYAERA